MSNISGTSALNRVVWLDCSKARPCTDFTFDDINIKPGKSDDKSLHYVCNNVVLDGENGLDACHPSGSTKEGERGPLDSPRRPLTPAGWDADAPM